MIILLLPWIVGFTIFGRQLIEMDGDAGTPSAIVLTNATGLPAAAVVVTPTGNIAATNAGAAINELDDEKLALADVVTVVGDPGSDTAWPSEQAVREAIAAVGSISTAVLTMEIDELNDTSDPYLLTAAELAGPVILTNADTVGADEWDFPERAEGWSFTFVIEETNNVTLDPNGTEQWYLNGSQMAEGEAIVNASPTVGEAVSCFSTEEAVFCRSSDADWAEATP